MRTSVDLNFLTLLDYIFSIQDLDRITEADELFDAVLTGSVDQEQNVAKKLAAAKVASNEGKPKPATVKGEKGATVKRKLSLYIGNFPWVCFITQSSL